ncbi:MAG: hypothetical protein WD009_05660 [Phycisphaeraceae bacterium]
MIVRIRQAEVALADGRLEEACELARRPQVRAHRQGQRLVTRLVAALVARGREHLAGDQAGEALRDAALARELGGAQPQVVAIEAEAAQAMAGARAVAERRLALPGRVREAMARGELSRAGSLLERGAGLELSMTDAASEIEQRRREAGAAADRARAALAAGRLEEAMAALEPARRLHAGGEQVAALTRALADAVADRVDADLADGRLARAAALLTRAEAVVEQGDRLAEQRQVVRQCRAAAEAVEVGELDEAAAILRRARTLLPAADWLGPCLTRVDEARAARDALREGPLGGLTLFDAPPDAGDSPMAIRGLPTNDAPAPAAATLPARFHVQVEGGESVLVVRGRCVSLGAVSGRGTVDVPFVLAPDVPAVRIEQVADEHIATADAGVVVNAVRASRRPLLVGDRIHIGPRGTVRYARPHPASGTAVLDLEGLRLGRSDVRRVVLLCGPLVIGGGTTAHVRAPHLAHPIVLHERGGGLWVRAGDATAEAGAREVAIVPGQAASIGGAKIEVTGA